MPLHAVAHDPAADEKIKGEIMDPARRQRRIVREQGAHLRDRAEAALGALSHRLREQQDASGGFQCFIPLAFYPPGTKLADRPGPSGVDSLKTMAVARLLLDNFPHVKAYWVMLGKRLAQVALHYGANDLDGTITEGGELTESYSVESNNEVKINKNEIAALIEDAGFEAVERDTLYHPIGEMTAA